MMYEINMCTYPASNLLPYTGSIMYNAGLCMSTPTPAAFHVPVQSMDIVLVL